MFRTKSLLDRPIPVQCENCHSEGYAPEQWKGLRKQCSDCEETYLVKEYYPDND